MPDKLYSDEGIYSNPLYSGPGVSRGLIISQIVHNGAFVDITPDSKILVVGAGHGYEVINYIKHGYDTRSIDIYVPRVEMVKNVTTVANAEDMPFEDKEFDIVHCTEVLEHVTEKAAYNIILESKRVAKHFVYTIATRGDAPFNTHINVHEGWWWMEVFDRLGMKIKSASVAPRVFIRAYMNIVRLCWPDGVLIYGSC